MEIPSTWSACHYVILNSLMIMLILETSSMLTANIKLSSYGERMYFYIRYQLRNLHSSHGSIHLQIGCLWNDGSANSCHTQQCCYEMTAKVISNLNCHLVFFIPLPKWWGTFCRLWDRNPQNTKYCFLTPLCVSTFKSSQKKIDFQFPLSSVIAEFRNEITYSSAALSL